MFRRLALVVALTLAAPAAAQEQPNLMIVFDGSGSMWGRIDGVTKIELARRALSQVLSEASPEMQIGMLAYGHRTRGQCSDIETMVPMGPAIDTVPQIIAAANGMNPRGMTPISDSVMIAAEGMGFTEQSATVVLLTDGIETCDGDPCALGRALAAQGVDFRAHVVGFDLSDDEQRQVSCLAEETGGLFLAAGDSATLAAALATTLSAAPQPLPEPPPPPVLAAREVQLVLRDVAGGDVLTGRPFPMMEFLPADESAAAVQPRLGLNPGPITGTVALTPGDWQLVALRETNAGRSIPISLPVTIPDGAGPYTLDLILAARLQITPLLAQSQPLPAGGGRLPTMAGQGWAEFAIHPIVNGAIDPALDYADFVNAQDVALPPGDYFVRGTLSGMLTRERLVHVPQGQTTMVDFDFRAIPVTFDMRDASGVPTDRREVRIFDIDATAPFVSGQTRDAGGLLPVYLPPGIWRATFGTEPAAEIVFATGEPGVPMTIRVGPGDTPDPLLAESATPNCAAIHRAQGCVAEAVTPADVAAFQGSAMPLPRFTGTWAAEEGMMLLVQEGRRVWGEVYINGGIGRVWGHVAPDGLTLRGAMDRGGNPRGAVEMRLSHDGGQIFAVWDHNIARMGTTLSARRLSGALPALTVATGTEADLRVTMAGEPWAPADSAEFAAFMAPALAPADPNTGEDIDAMQAAAPPLGFTGVWATNHQVLTLVQDGRIVRGTRDHGPLVGEVSADGRTLRGIWDNGGQWGLFEFRLDPDRMAFEGGWGMAGDTDLRGGVWTGTRRGYLADPGPVPMHPALADMALAPWFDPVRDPDPVVVPVVGPAAIDPPAPDAATPAIGAIDLLPEGGIYARLPARMGESTADAFARLFDGSADAAMADACVNRPVVLHDDGLIAERVFDPAAAQAGGPAYRTERFQICDQSGPLLICRHFERPLSAVPGPHDFEYPAEIVAGPMGSFGLVDLDFGAMVMFHECRGEPGQFLDPLSRLPDGRLVVDEIVQREDRAQAALPAGVAPVPGSLDFAALEGVWAQADDLDWGCRAYPGYLHADGELVTWGGNWTGGEPLGRLSCGPDGTCTVLSADADAGDIPGDIRLEARAERLSLCSDGACDVTLGRCDAVLTADEIALMARRVGGTGPDTAAAAPLDFAALTGHWAPVSSYGRDSDCLGGGLYVHSDGTAVAWNDTGAALDHALTLSCAPDGSCEVRDAGSRPMPDVRFTLQSPGAGALRLCVDGDCTTGMMSCAGVDLPPDRAATISTIPAP